MIGLGCLDRAVEKISESGNWLTSLLYPTKKYLITN